jgi:hypothetical protein
VRLTTYHHIVPMSRNLGAVTLLDPSGPAWPVMVVLYLTSQGYIHKYENLKRKIYNCNTNIYFLGTGHTVVFKFYHWEIYMVYWTVRCSNNGGGGEIFRTRPDRL